MGLMVGGDELRGLDEVTERHSGRRLQGAERGTDERIRLSREDSSRRMKQLCLPIKALTTLRW